MTTFQVDDLQNKVHSMVKQMAEFTALYESVAGELAHREERIKHMCTQTQGFIEEKMNNIETMLSDFESILTQAGVARWRLAAEQTQRAGEAHLHALQETCETIHAQVQTACYGIERTCDDAANKLSEAAKHLNIEELKAITQQTTKKVDSVSADAVKKIASVAKLFHWERFGMAVIVAIVSAVLTGMFINDESPVESRKKALAERQAGRVLMAAWPNLDEEQRQHINKVANI